MLSLSFCSSSQVAATPKRKQRKLVYPKLKAGREL
jgi:hypothetical protein